MALLDRRRAALPLSAHAEFLGERRRRDRLRDVARVLRSQAKNGRRFSLRTNSDFDAALHHLRAHHEESWVGEALEGVWRLMFAQGQLIIFELWVLEADGSEKLIAADFGHPHSSFGFYVATRFFDRAYKTAMPGFILAFSESEVLSRLGFQLWDLGGSNASPMMHYKSQVAIEMRRPVFLSHLHAMKARRPSMTPARSVDPGVHLPEIREADLWGFTRLERGGTKAAKKSGAKSCDKAPKAAKKPTREPPPGGWPKRASPGTSPSNDKRAFVPPPREDSCASAGKDATRERFQALFSTLCSQGLSTNEAAAKALLLLKQGAVSDGQQPPSSSAGRPL